MHVEEALLDYLFFPVLCDYFFVHCLFLRVLNDILHPQQSFLIIVRIIDVLVEEGLYHMLSCLVAIVLNEVVNDQLV